MDTTHKKRDELHKLIDILPEKEILTVERFLRFLIKEIYEEITPEEDDAGLKETIETLRKPFEQPEGKPYSVLVYDKEYNVLLYPDLESGGYWIDCPSLSGCASQGETEEEALEMIKDSIKGHLEILQSL